jgi:hypothetical protein
MVEEGLAAFARTLGEVHVEHDACHVHANAIRWDFFVQVCVSSSRSKQHTNHGRTLEEHQILVIL